MIRIRIATAILTVAVAGLFGWSCRLMQDLRESERMEAVGGVETYRSQRVAALRAMKDKLDIKAPDVRRAQMDEIDRMISEIENETTEEIGEEARRVK